SGSFLPAALLPAVGLAGLIAISQLCTYASALAPATPYAILVASLAGFALSRARLTALARSVRERWLGPALPLLAYALALAPVLLAGRPSFSSYLVLGDSAVHMVGADYLVRHGQDFAHLDLRNSYGLTLDAYYNSSYPSGADTVLGASARLLGLPVIWAFQPFNAFVLALASGPAWLLARRTGLGAAGAALAALAATLSALVYGYELIGSIKELTALAMILTLGALAVMHRRWLLGPANRAVVLALVLAGGVSALGVGFGAWGGVTVALLLAVLLATLRARQARPRRAVALCATAAVVTVVAALPTFLDVGGSLHVATTIASTSNPGNLHTALRWDEVLGVWLRDSYKQPPTGVARAFTDALVAIALAACALGVLGMLRARAYALLAWLLAMVALLAAVSLYATTWVDAKGLMITSPIVVLIAWAGVGALRGGAGRLTGAPRRAAGAALALALIGGVLASDAAQYHAANLAPSARYEELASLDRAYARRGPVLFTDFDEYALYVLRDLDVGGPNFTSPPPALAGLSSGRGQPVVLDRAAPAALAAYPLIVTRRDPTASPPPAAYAEVWRGTYYEVWQRVHGAPIALEHLARSLAGTGYCARLRALAGTARARHTTLVAASQPEAVSISVRDLPLHARWGRTAYGVLMTRAGSLSVPFSVPSAGEWDVYLAGEFSPAFDVRVDGRRLATVEGELGGNSLVPNLTAPARVSLAAGRHEVVITRRSDAVAPGDGGAAVLDRVYVARASAPARTRVRLDARASTGGLCAGGYTWVEALPRG
ncbi:MAG TPA: hypothetical protein VH115_04475, partial [Solirubrobacteraceae bacterium]|nr:hypothetical protein [Solirubrobacteraceae bacterium]